ncbi:hypothetical protein E1B28_006872 [Marasmius oreades]|uniref:Uncharacterized protein n=1 Tax=Marasmius oreades TaxID=181124 RepID=A0A9P7UT71_9AGAR|nr:uncharacterized protein E1B28_006872 [Marasmius oreades]KAG7093183.1 hypothetical protein E1B28_006872 [Marasmius oreades]
MYAHRPDSILFAYSNTLHSITKSQVGRGQGESKTGYRKQELMTERERKGRVYRLLAVVLTRGEQVGNVQIKIRLHQASSLITSSLMMN